MLTGAQDQAIGASHHGATAGLLDTGNPSAKRFMPQPILVLQTNNPTPLGCLVEAVNANMSMMPPRLGLLCEEAMVAVAALMAYH